MPCGDRTGPMGTGPMTGRGAGFCAGYGAPGYANPVPGRGMGMGFGRGFRGCGIGGGRGWRHWFYATGMPGWMRGRGYPAVYEALSPEMEKRALKCQADALQSELESVRKRLSEIDTETKAE